MQRQENILIGLIIQNTQPNHVQPRASRFNPIAVPTLAIKPSHKFNTLCRTYKVLNFGKPEPNDP